MLASGVKVQGADDVDSWLPVVFLCVWKGDLNISSDPVL